MSNISQGQKWRNNCGAELVIVESAAFHLDVLANDIWLAEPVGETFGPSRYYVTEHSLESCGYVPVRDVTVLNESDVVIPDRIDVWPTDDDHLRDDTWRDRRGDVWYHDREWTWERSNGERSFHPWGKPFDGPWTRVTHA